jgi:GT2 family glycosyltransferase
MTDVQTLAVLMTCHNRREKTLLCLRKVFGQTGIEGIEVHVFLVDDGSTDGTSESVREQFPQVNLIAGNGNLFWNGGMREAVAHACARGFDFYLLLNDDSDLMPDALGRLFGTWRSLPQPSIVVGSLCDPVTGKLTYGGSRTVSRLNPLHTVMVEPTDVPQECDVFNGNVVLVPRAAMETLENLSERFTHRSGDYELALRAKRHGIRSWIAPGFFGRCGRNAVTGTWRDPALPARVRIKKFLAPTGSPVRERWYLMSRYGGPLWPIYFVSAHVRFMLSLLKRGHG